jgi:hypothetical protein
MAFSLRTWGPLGLAPRRAGHDIAIAGCAGSIEPATRAPCVRADHRRACPGLRASGFCCYRPSRELCEASGGRSCPSWQLLLVGCGDDNNRLLDAGPEDLGSVEMDVPSTDLGSVDAGPVDTGLDVAGDRGTRVDAGATDAGSMDVSDVATPDRPDVAVADAGTPDAGHRRRDSALDAGRRRPDVGAWTRAPPTRAPPMSPAGALDVGAADSGTADAGVVDASSPRGTPVLDGIIGSDWPAGALVATNTIASAWGDANSLRSIRVAWDGTRLYLGIDGVVEASNAMLVFIDRDYVAGMTPTGAPIVSALSDGMGSLDNSISCNITEAPGGLRRRHGLGHARHALQDRHRAARSHRPARGRLHRLPQRLPLDPGRLGRVRRRRDPLLRGRHRVDRPLRRRPPARAPRSASSSASPTSRATTSATTSASPSRRRDAPRARVVVHALPTTLRAPGARTPFMPRLPRRGADLSDSAPLGRARGDEQQVAAALVGGRPRDPQHHAPRVALAQPHQRLDRRAERGGAVGASRTVPRTCTGASSVVSKSITRRATHTGAPSVTGNPELSAGSMSRR